MHRLDKLQGAAHFEISEKTAKAIILEMLEKLSGYLVPKLVYEKSGKSSKIPVAL